MPLAAILPPMRDAIGYYVHHQGQGHLDRARRIADALDDRVTLLGTGLAGRTGRHACVDLPDDRCDSRFAGSDFTGSDFTGSRARALHYAPAGHPGIASRVARIANWIAAARPALFVVDVSVEIAMLARLASVPVLYVRLAGRRIDTAHIEAFAGARALLAPFAEALDTPGTPAWVRARTFYAPGLCARPLRGDRQDRVLLVLLGRGGDGPQDPVSFAAMAAALPGWHIRVAGDVRSTTTPPANLELLGWIDDVAAEIGGAALVVGAAGDGVVNLVLAADAPFICIPEQRPYDEQCSKADALGAAGAAIVCACWPQPGEWPALVDAALGLDGGARHGLDDPDGVARTAAFIAHLAQHPMSQAMA